MANGGITQKIQVLKETAYGDGGAAGEKVFGVTKSFEWSVESSVNQSYGLETSGPQATVNTDGVFAVTGTHEWELTDGREYEAIMGSLTDNDPDFTLDVANSLPSYSVKVVEDAENSKFLIIKGLKYTGFSIAMSRDETITVTADWVAQTIENTTTFTPTVATVEPLVYLDGYVTLGGTAQTGVDNVTLEVQRNLVPRRFVEQTSTNEKRLISAIIEGPLNISFSGQISGQRAMIEEMWGSTSMTDTRSDTTFNFIAERGSVALNLAVTGARMTTLGHPMAKDDEISLQDFAGVGLDISGTGTYSS